MGKIPRVLRRTPRRPRKLNLSDIRIRRRSWNSWLCRRGNSINIFPRTRLRRHRTGRIRILYRHGLWCRRTMLVHVIWNRLIEIPWLRLLLTWTSVTGTVTPVEMNVCIGVVFDTLWVDDEWLRIGRRVGVDYERLGIGRRLRLSARHDNNVWLRCRFWVFLLRLRFRWWFDRSLDLEFNNTAIVLDILSISPSSTILPSPLIPTLIFERQLSISMEISQLEPSLVRMSRIPSLGIVRNKPSPTIGPVLQPRVTVPSISRRNIVLPSSMIGHVLLL